MTRLVVLGLNAYHADSAACVLIDGRLAAAAEEERFNRIKHWSGLPTKSIEFCLGEAGVEPGDVDLVAINRDPRANLRRRALHVAMRGPDARVVVDRFRNARTWSSIGAEIETAVPRLRAKVVHVEHHLAHLASAYLVSPFDEAVAVSVDGSGDFATAAWGLGRGDAVDVQGRVFFPHSLGIFYEALTQYLGFPNYGDEYKVMGLAAYGQPTFRDQVGKLVQIRDDGTYRLDLEYFLHHRSNVGYRWKNCAPSNLRLFSPRLEEMLGPARSSEDEMTDRHRDIARSVQAVYEDAFFNLLNRVHARYKIDDLALAGGCAMNSVANGKVYQQTPFRRLYVQAAAGDAGGAIGAAASVSAARIGRRFVMQTAAWGPGFSPDELKALIDRNSEQLVAAGCEMTTLSDEERLCRYTAEMIADGKVVGWFQGRMEWGPRALGNRSIVCDPRRADMKHILNAKIKRRESFRPFAPSVLREHVGAWFETDDDVPFMLQVYKIRAERRSEIPAVTHVDGTGRLQTVDREVNSRYHALIDAFHRHTGVPMVLNTSFNENEPIVCRPSEALDCFLRTKMDALVIGDLVIERSSERETQLTLPKAAEETTQ